VADAARLALAEVGAGEIVPVDAAPAKAASETPGTPPTLNRSIERM